MEAVKCPGRWAVAEIISGHIVQPLSSGMLIAWDYNGGSGHLATESRLWVGEQHRYYGTWFPKIEQIWRTNNGYRFQTQRRIFELTPVE